MTPFSRRAYLGTLTAAGGLAVTGLSTGTANASARRWHRAADDVRAEVRHAWQSYKRCAWGHDQLLPVSGGHSEFFDDAHPEELCFVVALGLFFFLGLVVVL